MLQCGKTLNINKYNRHQQQQQPLPQQQQQNLIQKQQLPQSQSQSQLQLKAIQQNKFFSTTTNAVVGKNLNLTSLSTAREISSVAAAGVSATDLAAMNFNLPLISKQLYNENGDNIEQNKLHFIDYDEI